MSLFKEVTKVKSREIIKDELNRFITKDMTVLWNGTSAISKDLAVILDADEVLEGIADGCKVSIFSFLKSGRYFRCYMVLTNKRFIYLEKARMILSIFPFLHKKIMISIGDIQNILLQKTKGGESLFYGVKFTLFTKNKPYNFYVLNLKSAEAFKVILERDQRNGEKESSSYNQRNKQKFCSNCGKQLESEWVQCPYCENKTN